MQLFNILGGLFELTILKLKDFFGSPKRDPWNDYFYAKGTCMKLKQASKQVMKGLIHNFGKSCSVKTN